MGGENKRLQQEYFYKRNMQQMCENKNYAEAARQKRKFWVERRYMSCKRIGIRRVQ